MITLSLWGLGAISNGTASVRTLDGSGRNASGDSEDGGDLGELHVDGV